MVDTLFHQSRKQARQKCIKKSGAAARPRGPESDACQITRKEGCPYQKLGISNSGGRAAETRCVFHGGQLEGLW